VLLVTKALRAVVVHTGRDGSSSQNRRFPMLCGPSTHQPRHGIVSFGSTPGRGPIASAQRGHGIRLEGSAVMERFRTTITPVLSIRQAAQAVVFYRWTFGAEEFYRST